MNSVPIIREFEDNRLLPLLFGEHNRHLQYIERKLGVDFYSRGNSLSIDGDDEAVEIARAALDELYKRLRQGQEIDLQVIDAAIRMAEGKCLKEEGISLHTRKKNIEARSPGQLNYLKMMQNHELVFALGPAGTGKTFLAVAQAVSMMLRGRIDRIILSRPAVEAGERLGFLPGDLKDKVDPYLRPLYDALHEMLPAEHVAKAIASGQIEIAPLAFMRGRTLNGAFIILDEAQNTTPAQMKMFLTRLGDSSRMVITGDPSQIDLPKDVKSGLVHSLKLLNGVKGIAKIELGRADVMRHPLVSRIIAAYEQENA